MPDLNGKTVLVTGGAGSLGVPLIEGLLKTNAKAIRVFDSNEYGLFLLNRQLKDPRLRSLLGDVKDRDRVALAIRGADIVIHTAALKNIEVTEYNVPEAIRTNIDGTVNLVELALLDTVQKFLFVSSDKAVNSPTLYGSTKYAGERVVLWAGRVSDKAFSCVRMGNFLESRGNVFELWERQAAKGEPLTLTDPGMMRYYLRTGDAATFVLRSLESMRGGEIFIPKMKEYNIMDLLKELYPERKVQLIGLRAGERIREELLTSEEAKRATETETELIIR